MKRIFRWFYLMIAVSVATLRQAPRRLGSSVASVIGIGGVVLVFVTVLAMAEGFRDAMASGTDRTTGIVLSGGSDSELNSGLGREDVAIISQAPEVLRGEDGEPLASAELFTVTQVPKRSTGTDANVVLRGVEPIASELRDDFRLVEGFRFEPGQYQFISGASAVRQFAGLEPGSEQQFGVIPWIATGVFDDAGGIAESELWASLPILQSAFHRSGSYSSVRVRTSSTEDLVALKERLEADPRLNVRVLSERVYYLRQSSTLYALIKTLGSLVVVLMSIGATFGAVNAVYATVGERQTEIAILRALGFPASSVLASVLAESVVLALVGGGLGGLLAYVAVDGLQTATLNWSTFSQVAFTFEVTPDLLVEGMVAAATLGVLAGVLPALRAVRLKVAPTLRQQ